MLILYQRETAQSTQFRLHLDSLYYSIMTYSNEDSTLSKTRAMELILFEIQNIYCALPNNPMYNELNHLVNMMGT